MHHWFWHQAPPETMMGGPCCKGGGLLLWLSAVLIQPFNTWSSSSKIQLDFMIKAARTPTGQGALLDMVWSGGPTTYAASACPPVL